MPTSTPRPPTMREIAARTGRSKSAVSLALRDDPRLAEETRREIQTAAERMGYRRNAVLAHLMAELRNARSGPRPASLAVVNCSPDRRLYAWHTFRDFRAGARDRAEQLGYSTDDFWLNEPGLRPARLRQIIQTRGHSGLVLIGAQRLDVLHDTHDELWSHFPAATVGVVRTNPHLACVCCDHFQTAHQATTLALARGYRKPGLVLEAALDELTDHRFAGGYYAAAAGLPLDRRAPIYRSDDRGGRAFADWFETHRPDIILTLHEQVRDWLGEQGEPGKSAGVVHLDWHEGIRDCAGMRQDNLTAGARVVDLVVSQIHSNERGASRTPMLTLVESGWVEGDSLRPPPDAQGAGSGATVSTPGGASKITPSVKRTRRVSRPEL